MFPKLYNFLKNQGVKRLSFLSIDSKKRRNVYSHSPFFKISDKIYIKSRVFHFVPVLYPKQVKLKNLKRMKTLKIRLLITFVCTSLVIFSSCSKDDEVLRDNISTDQTDDVSDNSDDGNDNDNSPSGRNGEITLYKVNGEIITKIKDYQVSGQDLAYQQDTKKHQDIWTLVKKVMPTAYRSKMNEFLIYNGEANGSAGFVFETAQDLSKWRMGIAINFADNQQELTYTIIHEFGHILTLNNDQVDASISESSCNNYFTGEGCSKTNSYIHKLQSQFWADIWTQYQTAQSSQSGLQQFYNSYSDRFVTQYAATNPGEDIAEVFATFVTRNSGANGNSIAEQKIQLMYNHTELVDLRNYIRGNLGASSRSRNSMLPVPGSWKQANSFGNAKKSHCSIK